MTRRPSGCGPSKSLVGRFPGPGLPQSPGELSVPRNTTSDKGRETYLAFIGLNAKQELRARMPELSAVRTLDLREVRIQRASGRSLLVTGELLGQTLEVWSGAAEATTGRVARFVMSLLNARATRPRLPSSERAVSEGLPRRGS